jgi:nitrogen regulatory protein PII
MKKMEVVMKSSAFDTFRESAMRLGISEYDVSDVRLSPGFAASERRRFYRGQEYNLELLSRIKVEFAVFDGDAKPVAQDLLTLVAPDSIAISALDEVISMSTKPVYAVSSPLTEGGASEIAGVTH